LQSFSGTHPQTTLQQVISGRVKRFHWS